MLKMVLCFFEVGCMIEQALLNAAFLLLLCFTVWPKIGVH